MISDIYSVSYKMKKELYHRILSVILVCFLCISFISIVMTFIIFPVLSKSDSMTPDVPSGSVELVTPLVKTPARGDVMLVKNSGMKKISVPQKAANVLCLFFTARQWMPFEARPEAKPVLRRVVALPGDTIYMKNHVLFIKPAGEKQFLTEFELTETKYNVAMKSFSKDIDLEFGSTGFFEEMTLGKDEYFLLGDNRLECTDSRLWGPVKKDSFMGKALLVYFPFAKFRLF